jgi:hypothetical protein
MAAMAALMRLQSKPVGGSAIPVIGLGQIVIAWSASSSARARIWSRPHAS